MVLISWQTKWLWNLTIFYLTCNQSFYLYLNQCLGFFILLFLVHCTEIEFLSFTTPYHIYTVCLGPVTQNSTEHVCWQAAATFTTGAAPMLHRLLSAGLHCVRSREGTWTCGSDRTWFQTPAQPFSSHIAFEKSPKVAFLGLLFSYVKKG